MSTAKKTTTSTANSNTPTQAKDATMKAVKTTQDAADKVVNMSTEAVQQFWQHGNQEAEKAREKVMAIGRESAESLTRTADTAAKNVSEAMDITRGNVEAWVECSNIATEAMRELSTDLYNYSNKSFAENLEASKQLFSCRTANDFMELQNQLFRDNINNFFKQTGKLTDKMFRYSQDVSEPMQERFSETSTKINKALAS